MAIIYRTAGAWGAGKGSRLTSTEEDNNKWELYSQIQTVAASIPAASRGVSSVTVTGDQMSLIMTDASTEGPFTLPTVTTPYRGAWAPSTAYLKYDRFTNNGNLYEVLFPHTSGLTFSPTANDGIGHDYYELILSNPGASLPTGGATGALMAKASSADFDFTTIDQSALSIGAGQLTGTIPSARLPLPTTTLIGGVKAITAGANKFMTSIGTDGVPVLAQPDFNDLTGTISQAQLASISTPPLKQTSTGISGDATLDITFANTYTRSGNSTLATITIPPESSVAWANNTEITIRQSAAGQILFVGGAGVTLNIPTGFLAKTSVQGSVVTLKRAFADTWDIFGLLVTA